MVGRAATEEVAASETAADVGRLVLRLSLGLLILLHGISKIRGGPGFVLDVVEKAGLPDPFGYLVYVGEVLAPLLVVIGLWTRAAALVIAINILVAILLVHTGQLLQLSPEGGWALELQGLYLAVPIAIALLGAGRYSVAGRAGRWNASALRACSIRGSLSPRRTRKNRFSPCCHARRSRPGIWEWWAKPRTVA